MGKLKFVYIVYGVFIFPFEPHSLQREYSDNYRPLFLRKLNIQSTREKFDDKKKKKRKKSTKYKIQSRGSHQNCPPRQISHHSHLPIKFDYYSRFPSFFIEQLNFQFSLLSFFLFYKWICISHLPYRIYLFQTYLLHTNILHKILKSCEYKI